ncbi:MAG: TolC family protein, partial [Desulfobacula sp.]|nr:TolC family protein [Desulfobacula sp.]
MKRSVLLVMLAGMVFFSGCKSFEPEPQISLSLTIPEKFSIEAGQSEPTENWWLFWGSDELNVLITDAVDNNFDIKILKTKIAQAKAGIAKENASFFPDLGFSLGG